MFTKSLLTIALMAGALMGSINSALASLLKTDSIDRHPRPKKFQPRLSVKLFARKATVLRIRLMRKLLFLILTALFWGSLVPATSASAGRFRCEQVALAGPSAKDLGLTKRDFNTILKAQKQGWRKLNTPFVLRTADGIFTGKLAIGHSSSMIFLDPERNVIIKILHTSNPRKLFDYERWVTQYLMGQNIRVPEILSAGVEVVSPLQWKEFNYQQLPSSWPQDWIRANSSQFTFIIKEYIPGILYSDLFDPWTGFRGPDKELGDKLGRALDDEQDKIKTLFTDGGFRNWLVMRGLDGQLDDKLASEGDLKDDNFLLSFTEGWLLFDP